MERRRSETAAARSGSCQSRSGRSLMIIVSSFKTALAEHSAAEYAKEGRGCWGGHYVCWGEDCLRDGGLSAGRRIVCWEEGRLREGGLSSWEEGGRLLEGRLIVCWKEAFLLRVGSEDCLLGGGSGDCLLGGGSEDCLLGGGSDHFLLGGGSYDGRGTVCWEADHLLGGGLLSGMLGGTLLSAGRGIVCGTGNCMPEGELSSGRRIVCWEEGRRIVC